jgi:hypothetical protein
VKLRIRLIDSWQYLMEAIDTQDFDIIVIIANIRHGGLFQIKVFYL